MTNKNPFYNLKLDAEEKQIEKDIEAGLYKPVKNFTKRKKQLQGYVKNTINKKKNINIRISAGDIFQLKVKAVEEGIPYQTLVSSVIHKYVNGRVTFL